MRTITTSDREYTLEVFPCEQDDHDTFTAGDCWKLAHELHLRGIGALVSITDREDSDFWVHMAVELPDGNFLDANGIQTRDQILRRWAGFLPSGKSATETLDAANGARWNELTWGQNQDDTAPEDVSNFADQLIEWFEDL